MGGRLSNYGTRFGVVIVGQFHDENGRYTEFLAKVTSNRISGTGIGEYHFGLTNNQVDFYECDSESEAKEVVKTVRAPGDCAGQLLDHHRGPALGAVDDVAAGQPLRIAEDVLADPGRWHVGQHFLALGQVVEVGAGLGPVEQAEVGVHHALGVAGGAGGVADEGEVAGLSQLSYDAPGGTSGMTRTLQAGNAAAVINGVPQYDASVPALRLHGRRIAPGANRPDRLIGDNYFWNQTFRDTK